MDESDSNFDLSNCDVGDTGGAFAAGDALDMKVDGEVPGVVLENRFFLGRLMAAASVPVRAQGSS